MHPTFVADCNVGKLARWLRALGYDTEYRRVIGDAELVAIALSQDRVLLTRDLDLTRRRVIVNGTVRTVLLKSDRIEEQLRQVVRELGLSEENALTRCLECNELLVAVSAAAVMARVPPYVGRTQTRYSECRRCGRIYWAGTHWSRIRRRLGAAVVPVA